MGCFSRRAICHRASQASLSHSILFSGALPISFLLLVPICGGGISWICFFPRNNTQVRSLGVSLVTQQRMCEALAAAPQLAFMPSLVCVTPPPPSPFMSV